MPRRVLFSVPVFRCAVQSLFSGWATATSSFHLIRPEDSRRQNAGIALTTMQLNSERQSYKQLHVFSPLVALRSNAGHGPVILEVPRITHKDAMRSVGLLCAGDQLVAETSTSQHTTVTTNIHTPERILSRNPSKRAAADPRVRPCGHWDQQLHVQLQCTWLHRLRILQTM